MYNRINKKFLKIDNINKRKLKFLFQYLVDFINNSSKLRKL